MNKTSLKQQIKSGDISPDEAIKLVKSNPVPSPAFLKWADKTGRQRYAAALKVSDKEANKK